MTHLPACGHCGLAITAVDDCSPRLYEDPRTLPISATLHRACAECEGTLCAHHRSAFERMRAQIDALEARLQALADVGITCEPIEHFEAFSPEAKAAYPTKPEFLIRTHQRQIVLVP